MPIIGTFLVLTAILSPLLTFLRLWQVKEWRIDRLKEHLRQENAVVQLIGKVRPAIICLAYVGSFFLEPHATLTGLTLLSLLSIVQIVLRKQRYPVWTKKTIILLFLSLLLNAGLVYTIVRLVTPVYTILILPIIQSIIVTIAWAIFLPVDQWMKRRIMNRAKALVSTFENLTVIGITGSVGKTTTKELIAHVLKDQNILYTPAYVNSEMGVSNWLLYTLSKKDRNEPLILIVEMGAYKEGEIARLCDITKPTLGVLTFIGNQHIALFGSQEKLTKAKGELFASLPEHGTAFVNADCDECANVLDGLAASVFKVGTGGSANLEAYDIEETRNGIRFSIEGTSLQCSLHGTHNVTNVLLAIAVAQKIGLPEAEIASGLRTFSPPHHTFSVLEKDSITLLDDTHNASATSFRAAIAWAKEQPMTEKVLLTPGLIELGAAEHHIHRELGSSAQGVFTRVLFSTKQGMESFAEGFEGNVELLSSNTAPLSPDALLVCVGRVQNRSIERLLPS